MDVTARLAVAAIVALRATYVVLAAAVLAYAGRSVVAFGATEHELADLQWWDPLGDATTGLFVAVLVTVQVTSVLVAAWWFDASRFGPWPRTVERLAVRALLAFALVVLAVRSETTEWSSAAAAGAAVAVASLVMVLTDLVARVAVLQKREVEQDLPQPSRH